MIELLSVISTKTCWMENLDLADKPLVSIPRDKFSLLNGQTDGVLGWILHWNADNLPVSLSVGEKSGEVLVI